LWRVIEAGAAEDSSRFCQEYDWLSLASTTKFVSAKKRRWHQFQFEPNAGGPKFAASEFRKERFL